MKDVAKEKLAEFIDRYNEQKYLLQTASEQTMRSWIDNFLQIFDWNCQDVNQVQQEIMVTREEKQKLKLIGSKHSKPDYTLKNGRVRVNFLDAKDLKDNIIESKEIAFQARSYGWSAGLDCSIVTNIEELAFYGCSTEPYVGENVELERICFNVDEYLDHFDLIYDLLARNKVLDGTQLTVLNEKINIKDKEKKYLDQSFAVLLSEFRIELAKNIYKNNYLYSEEYNDEFNIAIQSIINKILYIRICEGRFLEEENSLLNMMNGNFWSNFIENSFRDYDKHYDGPIFYDLNKIKDIKIDNTAFETIMKSFYGLSPYKFDVIPVELIADMYELFLSKEIRIKNGEVLEIEKAFYVKQQGAISTPKYLVDFLLEQTFEKFENILNLDELLELKILEPACGSGTFLLGILEKLENKATQLYVEGSIREDQKSLFVIIHNQTFTTIELRRQLISNCIFAIDMDFSAVQVARMSLALKVIDNYSYPYYNNEFGLNGEMLLFKVGENIVHGNTLVESDIMTKFPVIKRNRNFIKKLVPLDIKPQMAIVFENSERKMLGFDYIAGNPPYVETKRYIDGLPFCREYFKDRYRLDDEKADMSIYFIERCIELLNAKGKMGILCQRRFFKTNYGENTRRYLSENDFMDTIIEFRASDIFKKRTTYITMMILSNFADQKNEFKYLSLTEGATLLKYRLESIKDKDYSKKSSKLLKEGTWNFSDNNELDKLIINLSKKFNILDQLRKDKVCDIHGGIQVLRNDVYYINDWEIDKKNGIVHGINRRKGKNVTKNITVELDVCRPIIANKNFKKFQVVQPTYFAIVPYTLQGTHPIGFKELSKQYPACTEYLLENKDYVKENNKEVLSGDDWHLFTRTTNLKLFNGRKILFPMTAKEIVATYTNKPIYPDNANMWALTFNDEDDDFHLAITAILNAKLFSVMAIFYANPQANGYKKMNKQFVLPVPIPYDIMKDDDLVVKTLLTFAIDIYRLQIDLVHTPTEGEKRIIQNLIEGAYESLNNYVYDLYQLNDLERMTIEESYDLYMSMV